MIGVLVSDVAAVLNRERRGDPQDAYLFGMNGNSYQWVYVPTADQAIINDLQVKTGEKGDRDKVYPKLNMANPETIKQWGFSAPYALVEIEVNDGLGAPADASIVATKMTRLDDTEDDTEDYPRKVAEIVAIVKKKYDGWMKDQERAINDALALAQTKAVKDAKPRGRRMTTVMFVTWMTDTQRLQVRFLTRIFDDAFQEEPGSIDVPEDARGGRKPLPQKFRTAPSSASSSAWPTRFPGTAASRKR